MAKVAEMDAEHPASIRRRYLIRFEEDTLRQRQAAHVHSGRRISQRSRPSAFREAQLTGRGGCRAADGGYRHPDRGGRAGVAPGAPGWEPAFGLAGTPSPASAWRACLCETVIWS